MIDQGTPRAQSIVSVVEMKLIGLRCSRLHVFQSGFRVYLCVRTNMQKST
jgi:hypothetical protein